MVAIQVKYSKYIFIHQVRREAKQRCSLPSSNAYTVRSSVHIYLHARVDTRCLTATYNLLLDTHFAAVAQSCGSPRCDVKSVLLLRTGALLCSCKLCHTIKGLNVQGGGNVVALAGTELEVLVAAPEDNVGAPVGAVGCCSSGNGGLRDVLHYGGCVC